MIQRLQSIFLVLAAAMMALLFTRPMSFITTSNTTAQGMLGDGIFEVNDQIVLVALVVIGVLLPLVALFLFKHRKLQIKLSWLAIGLIIGIVISSLALFWQEYQSLTPSAEVSLSFGYIPLLVAIVLLIVAIRLIRKDEKLVRSADRLR
jgi:drug/metabolite transporter (DMT)-like permease